MNSFFSDSHIEGSAKFLTGLKKFDLLNSFHNGLCIDGTNKISLKRSLQHAMVLAPSGAGKTTSYIIPNLLHLKNASAVVLDPSAEIFNLCKGYLSRNFDVKVLNVTDLSVSERWNPLEKAETREDMKMVSEALVASAYPDSNGTDKFWNDGAVSLLKVFINSVRDQPQNRSLSYVYGMLNHFNASDKAVLNEHLSANLDEDLWLEFKGLISQPEKVFGSQLATAKIALSAISTPSLAELTSKSTVDFAEFRKTPTILFVVVPEHLVKNYSFLLSLLYRELFETFMEMPKKGDLPVYMLLDEVGNTFVPGLAGYITTLRKRLVSVSLILQSTRQLYSLYKDDADTILENTLSHIYFPGLSLETCQMLSQKLGEKRNSSGSYFLPTNESNKDKSKSALMSPESIRTLKSNRAIYIYGNLPPVMLRVKPWYKSFAMKNKVKR